ncbi:MAG: glycosyl transferase family 1 [Bacteroidales bacterium 45-6]|uniref:glycosyltransferase family 4 protein n=1 Tax=uncultured Dysgonomonas sp. TaxID=206096 RepID=UPI000959D487|nr:glycosyltransferase family 1 protein [uncultured Dysgonomonas sp.]OJU53250.1 MAG: glycosyl transferase family 1 [Bacteroidales bacterium 45-6]
MKLIVNARFLTQPITGVQRYAIEISLSLKKMLGTQLSFVAPPNVIHNDLADQFEVQIVGERTGHLWEQIDLLRFLRKNKSPLLINLCSTAPIFYNNQIVTHHDITYIRYPQSFSRKFTLLYKLLVPLMFKHSKKIITVSNFSQKEISLYYGIADEKFIIVPNAVDRHKFYPPIEYGESGRPQYFLAVSSHNFHKNFHGLIKAFLEASSHLDDIKLYIVGGADIDSFKKIDYGIDSKRNNSIHFLGRVDDTELLQLYQNAIAFIFPSFYEGFGIPPLEAQACGCPVVASNQASMPEILGESVLYFDPFSENELANLLVKVAKDEKLRSELRTMGIANISNYSWERSSEKLCLLIKDTLNSK